MNPRSTWFWLVAAAGLLGIIVLQRQFKPQPPAGPAPVIPALKASKITAVQIRPRGQVEIRVERTNDSWAITSPIHYPAQALSIDSLLTELERLTPATFISGAELRDRPNADEEYGFKNPQATIILHQGASLDLLFLVGATTAPGDQVFVKLVASEGIHVVDAPLLNLIPKHVNEWRDRALITVPALACTGLAVTNGPRAFELQRPGTTVPWRMSSPIDARANQDRIEHLLEQLDTVRINSFISDEPQVELEPFGLAPPELQLAFKRNTNTVALLQFGRSPTNAPSQVYARRPGLNSVVTVPKTLLEGWRGSVNDFRDPHLITSAEAVHAIEVQADDNFTLQRNTNGMWQVVPQNLPVDSELVTNLLRTLAGMQIVDFTKDVVTPIDLPKYGLADPSRKYVLFPRPTQATNTPLVELDFGTNQNDRVFVRRPDESSVYAIAAADFSRLPSASIQLRDRAIWDFSENEISSVTIRQNGQIRRLVRHAAHDWSLAPGSTGVINPLAVEETVRPLCHLSAQVWVAKGEQNRAKYGLSDSGHQVVLETSTGEKRTIDFGNPAPGQSAYAAVTLNNELWIFEFPASLYRFVANYLTIPPNSAWSRPLSPASISGTLSFNSPRSSPRLTDSDF